jgi:hypothetical protein
MKRRILKIVLKVLAGAVLLTLLAYGCDDLYARFRHKPFADVHVDRVYAVAEKFNQIDYVRSTPVTERCIYSLFPHFGQNPCWYVTRHTLRIIKVG